MSTCTSTELIEAIETAEGIADDLNGGMMLSRAESDLVGEFAKGLLVEAYNERRLAEGFKAESTLLFKRLLETLASARRYLGPVKSESNGFYAQDVRDDCEGLANAIRKDCVAIREYLGVVEISSPERMTKSAAAKRFKVTVRTIRRWLNNPERCPHQIKEVNHTHVDVIMPK